jgi:hypothetical protein
MSVGNDGRVLRVTCKNGHVSLFDKGKVCRESRDVPRDRGGGGGEGAMDRIYLSCTTCGTRLVVQIDCREYL